MRKFLGTRKLYRINKACVAMSLPAEYIRISNIPAGTHFHIYLKDNHVLELIPVIDEEDEK